MCKGSTSATHRIRETQARASRAKRGAGLIPARLPRADAKGAPFDSVDVSRDETNGTGGPPVNVAAESVTGATT